MVDPIDAPWNTSAASDDVLNKTTYGQGTAFPSIWPVNRLFLRTDVSIMFNNTGTLNSPIFTALTGPVTATILIFAGPISAIPSTALLCNGQAVSRTTFANLFAIIGTTYGIGNGSTTFNVPDFVTSNRFPRAATTDVNLGDKAGESAHSLSIAELASHTHTQTAHSHGIPRRATANGTGNNLTASNVTNSERIQSDAVQPGIQNTGSGTAHENKPPFIDIHFIIAT